MLPNNINFTNSRDLDYYFFFKYIQIGRHITDQKYEVRITFLMINWHNNTFSKNMYYRYQTFKIPCLLAVPKKTKRTWQCACWKTYLVRFWVDEVVELSLCLSVSVSECPLVMFPFKCPFIWGPPLSNSAILPITCPYIQHGLAVLCVWRNFVQPEFMPKHAWKQSIRPENHSRNEVIFSIGWEAFVFGFTPLHDV